MILLTGTDSSSMVLLAMGVVVLTFVVLRISRQRARRHDDPLSRPSAVRPRPSPDAAGQVREQLDELMVQIEELVRTANAQIDTRCAKLESLLAEADEKIARLQALSGPLGPSPSGGPNRPAPAASPSPAVRPEHRQIHELADAGQSPVQIAQAVGRDVGEVELILALRQR